MKIPGSAFDLPITEEQRHAEILPKNLRTELAVQPATHPAGQQMKNASHHLQSAVAESGKSDKFGDLLQARSVPIR